MAEQKLPAPTHYAYVLVKPTKGDEFLFKIGDGYPMADGSGFDIRMQILPTEGRILLRKVG